MAPVSGVEFVAGEQVNIGFERYGTPGGRAVVLLHGFPYDPRCYDEVATELAREGAEVIVPYLRGFGRRPIARRTPFDRANRPPLRRICVTSSSVSN